jgi:hypothetical protein
MKRTQIFVIVGLVPTTQTFLLARVPLKLGRRDKPDDDEVFGELPSTTHQ